MFERALPTPLSKSPLVRYSEMSSSRDLRLADATELAHLVEVRAEVQLFHLLAESRVSFHERRPRAAHECVHVEALLDGDHGGLCQQITDRGDARPRRGLGILRRYWLGFTSVLHD